MAELYREYIQQSKEVERFYHQVAAERGLPDSVMALLYTLCEEGEGRTPTQLYAEWALSKQTGHSALQWLVKRGWVRLVPAPEDRRGKRVELTEEGRLHTRQEIWPLLQAEKAAFASLTQEEQEQLVSLTAKLLSNIRKEMAGRLPAKDVRL